MATYQSNKTALYKWATSVWNHYTQDYDNLMMTPLKRGGDFVLITYTIVKSLHVFAVLTY